MIASRAVLSRPGAPPAALAVSARSGRGRKASVRASSDEAPTTTSTSDLPLSRRDLLVSSVAAASASAARPALAQIAQRNTFTIDSLPPFDIEIPSTWTFSDTEAPGAVGVGRPTRVWFPSDDPTAPGDANVSLVVTLVGADFTKLGSFGDAEAFGSQLVSSMDRGFAGGPSARLVSARKVSLQRRRKAGDDDGREDKPQEAYEIEYAVRRNKEEGERLFVSSVALSFDGIYNRKKLETLKIDETTLIQNRLYTLTGQTAAGEAAEKHGKEVEAIVKSFVPPATRF